MESLLVVLILVAIFSASGFVYYREKKKGAKCVGCPYSESCSSKTGK